MRKCLPAAALRPARSHLKDVEVKEQALYFSGGLGETPPVGQYD